MASDSVQSEGAKARVNIKLGLYTDALRQHVELPLELMVMADYRHGDEQRPLPERSTMNIDKNNFNNVLAELYPRVKSTAPNTFSQAPSALERTQA
ncbi:type VI secretion system contractile sheath small subunit [Pseudomonas guariconensis]|uniref:type VI secretion system contractile sheath small subunit n=1 Tax=Pseudomonas TaxID=286 RepID=UPI002097A1C4|nr:MULTISPECIES: type VI secretion system contractile sheath small subunit [Pseudomonas]MCO7639033.1 type VI secretion system contractile sheath small subunit [Pseudomonas sp. S 311-6]MCO7514329.1 type VI secretion system contractile sheath small subunit [Pseudomonas putida]MCO7564870.1 type VI secretion system contractile sheath small subunit [Pseudomonas mosselii]MCO7606012.1 type VI secretion system contractile sheath small subunit [Pseudomonas guariconensis]MCO7616149.1 type VI secretion s